MSWFITEEIFYIYGACSQNCVDCTRGQLGICAGVNYVDEEEDQEKGDEDN